MKNLLRRLLLDLLGRRRENAMWRANVENIDVRQCKSLVLLNLDGKLGDAILQSTLVREVTAAAAHCRISVVTSERLAGYWRECAGVTSVYAMHSRSDASTLRRLRELRRLSRISELAGTDVLLSFDPIPMIDHFAFVRLCRPRAAIGLSTTQYSIFQISISDPIFETPKQHAGERIVRTLRALGVTTKLGDLRGIVPRTVQWVDQTQKAGGRPKFRQFFLNGFGGSETRTFSPLQLDSVMRAVLASCPSIQIVVNVNGAQRVSREIRALTAEFHERVDLFPPAATVPMLFNSVAQSDVVLTPDTGVSHVAAATSTPVVIAFDDVGFNPICWRPLTERAICLIPDRPGPISNFSASDLVRCVQDAWLLTKSAGLEKM